MNSLDRSMYVGFVYSMISSLSLKLLSYFERFTPILVQIILLELSLWLWIW